MLGFYDGARETNLVVDALWNINEERGERVRGMRMDNFLLSGGPVCAGVCGAAARAGILKSFYTQRSHAIYQHC